MRIIVFGFPKILGTLLGVPIKRIRILGSILEPPWFRETTCYHQSYDPQFLVEAWHQAGRYNRLRDDIGNRV